MSYSAIIEIIGAKELAEDNPRDFLALTNKFRESIETKIQEILRRFSDQNNKFKVFIFRDHCYVEFASLKVLVQYIENLQIYFFDQRGYLFRSVITKGNLAMDSELNVKKKYDFLEHITHFGFGLVPSKLYGIMEKFKGAGIFVDDDILERDEEYNALKANTFVNYFVTDAINRKYLPFTDFSLPANSDFFKHSIRIFNKIYGDKLISKKLGRFYIPFILNMARHLSLNVSASYVSFHGLEYYIGKPLLNKIKDISGMELFYFIIIDRFFDENFQKEAETDKVLFDKISHVQQEIAKNSWLLEILRNDGKTFEIPKQILSPTKRRIALRKIAEILKEREPQKDS